MFPIFFQYIKLEQWKACLLVQVSTSPKLVGTYNSKTAITIPQANEKNFFCLTSNLSFTDLGAQICDYAKIAISISAPIISVNGNTITITPAIASIRFTGGTVFGLPNGVGARDTPRPDFTVAIPTTVYYE